MIAGIGVHRLGGSLAGTSHLSSYSVVTGDWDDAPLLATLPGATFAYASLPPVSGTASGEVDPADPQGFVTRALALPGKVGVFLDNTSAALATVNLPFVTAVGAALRAHGRPFMVNAEAYGAPAFGDGNDGSADAAWFHTTGPHATHLMCECWPQTSDGSDRLRLRGPEWWEQWDGWMRLPAAAHFAGCHFVPLVYGGSVGVANAIYARASLLLAPNAKSGDTLVYCTGSDPGGPDPWDPAWTTAPPTVDPVAGTASL